MSVVGPGSKRLFVLMIALVAVACACSSEKRLATACEAGDPGACDVLSARYAYGDGVPKDPARSAALGARAMKLCAHADGGASASCARYPRIASVPLELPPSSRGADAPSVLTIVLVANGTALVDDKPIPTDDAMLPAAKAAHDQNPEIRAVIKADASVSHGRVIHALDLLKQAQVTKIAFGVIPVAPVSSVP
jgi:biopolymer transport protein ExbD